MGDCSAWRSDNGRKQLRDFILAGRHLLGLGVASAIATQPCQCSGIDAERLDHEMACKLIARMKTFRHDIWASAVPFVAQGVVSVQNQAKGNLLAPDEHEGAAGLRRGGILAILPGACIVVLES